MVLFIEIFLPLSMRVRGVFSNLKTLTMAKKLRFTISKDDFLQYMINDSEDLLYIGKRILEHLKDKHHTYISTKMLFDEQAELPNYLFKDQLTQEELDSQDWEFIPIEEIYLEVSTKEE